MVKINLSLDNKAEYDLMLSALHNDMAFSKVGMEDEGLDRIARAACRARQANLASLIEKLS